MSITIDRISDRQGYVNFADFMDREFSAPSGDVTAFINAVASTISVDDYHLYTQELFDSDTGEYYGIILLTAANQIIFVNADSELIGRTETAQTLMTFEDFSIKTLSSGTHSMVSSSIPNLKVQVTNVVEFGTETFYIHLLDNTEKLASGRIEAQCVLGQVLASYNLKIDKTPYDVITLKAGRKSKTTFEIEIAEGIVSKFTYTQVGQLLFVQDTDHSRASLERLTKQGVVFIDE